MTNSESRKRKEEREARENKTAETLSSMDRAELEKLTIISLKLINEVQSYSRNVLELAPLTRGVADDPYNLGVAEGRCKQAANTLGVIGEFLAQLKIKVQGF